MIVAPKPDSRSGLAEIMTVAQVAEYLRLNKLTIYKYIHEGKLPAVKFGRTFRVRGEDVAAFLEAQRFGPKEKPRTVRTIPQHSTTPSPQPQPPSEELADRYVAHYRDITQSRETMESMLSYSPLDWVVRGLH